MVWFSFQGKLLLLNLVDCMRNHACIHYHICPSPRRLARSWSLEDQRNHVRLELRLRIRGRGRVRVLQVRGHNWAPELILIQPLLPIVPTRHSRAARVNLNGKERSVFRKSLSRKSGSQMSSIVTRRCQSEKTCFPALFNHLIRLAWQQNRVLHMVFSISRRMWVAL